MEEGRGRMGDGGRVRGDLALSIVPWPFGAIAPNSDWFKLNSKIKRINIPVV
jgi:hypothetical protein